MGLFMSPVKLYQVITTTSEMNEKIEKRTSQWYFSKKGEEAYQAAKTVPQKVMYFYNYIMDSRTDEDSYNEEFAQSIAYIMALSMDGTSKPYGSWPGIIDPEVNPLVKFALEYVVPSLSVIMEVAQDKDLDSTELSEYVNQKKVAYAIAAVRGLEDYEMFMPTTVDAYKNLTKNEADPELFLIERCIIFTLGKKYYDMENGVGPYNFYVSEEEE